MSVTAAVTYISGRAHATPGDASHNEGRVELPPSPWRILRALLATWYERAREVPEATVRSLFDKLAEAPPSFVVPPFALAHKRHYLPESAHKAGVSIATAKVLDGFAAINRSTPLYVTWPCELTEDERAAFASLLEELPYLGRAESMVNATLVDDLPSSDGSSHRLVDAHRDSPPGQRPIRLLCPTLPLQWDRLIDVPWKLRQKGQPLPLGAEMVRFGSDRPLVWERTPQWARPEAADAHVIEWMIQGKGKIPITAAVAFCSMLRRAVGSKPLIKSEQPWQLLGKIDDAPVQLDHVHAHFVVVPDKTRRFIDGLAVWIPEGLGAKFAEAASSVEELKNRRGEIEGQTDFRPVRLYLQHVGALESSRLAVLAPHVEESVDSRIWTSITPYAPARHLRSDNRFLRSLATDVNRELAARNLPEAVVERVLPVDLRLPHPLEYRRHRLNERLADGRAAYHLRLTFDEPQAGPIALGALAHFGLGWFRPAPPADGRSADSS